MRFKPKKKALRAMLLLLITFTLELGKSSFVLPSKGDLAYETLCILLVNNC